MASFILDSSSSEILLFLVKPSSLLQISTLVDTRSTTPGCPCWCSFWLMQSSFKTTWTASSWGRCFVSKYRCTHDATHFQCHKVQRGDKQMELPRSLYEDPTNELKAAIRPLIISSVWLTTREFDVVLVVERKSSRSSMQTSQGFNVVLLEKNCCISQYYKIANIQRFSFLTCWSRCLSPCISLWSGSVQQSM